MSPVAIIFTITLILSGIGLVVFVLLHSGKGTGISEMISSSMYNTQSGSIVEKNLDRLTLICVAVFIISLIVLMITYPQGTIGA
ncbi:MAG: preprotein translocase subunit SecG [Anaerotardibacter sp.]